MESKSLDIAKICKRIAVHRPYFAFSDLYAIGDSCILGAFAPEQSVGYELGPISSAELGRHLAILGSCAAAVDAPDDMTYYLASKGRLELIPSAHTSGTAQKGTAIATVTSRSRRTMTAEVVGNCGLVTAHLRCEYQVLSASVFSRIFTGHYTGSLTPPLQSPYRTPLTFDATQIGTNRMVVRTGQVSPESFAGHFDDYPSWPVAIIADTFGQVRTALLHNMLDRQTSYRVSFLNVDALQLAPARAQLIYDVECTMSLKTLGRFKFVANVSWGDITVATMESEVYTTNEWDLDALIAK